MAGEEQETGQSMRTSAPVIFISFSDVTKVTKGRVELQQGRCPLFFRSSDVRADREGAFVVGAPFVFPNGKRKCATR